MNAINSDRIPAEELAEDFERGELDVRTRGSGKQRTKLEQAENKFREPGGHTRVIAEHLEKSHDNQKMGAFAKGANTGKE